MVCKREGTDHFLTIDYYFPFSLVVDGQKATGSFYGALPGRVMSLAAPVGTTNEPVRICKIEYESGLERVTDPGLAYPTRITSVYDAYGHKTAYESNIHSRLTSITKFIQKDCLFKKALIQELVWGKDDDACNLQEIILKNGDEKPVVSRRFFYDAKGNVKKNRLTGMITGEGDGNDVCDHVMQHWVRGRNLKNSETLPNGTRIEYGYKPHSNLMDRKFVCEGKQIKLREFYSYDTHATLIEKITDDGIGRTSSDLAGVTTRLISRTLPRDKAPFGFPMETAEYALDLTSGEEKLLSRIVYEFSEDGNPLRRDHYDAHNEFRYSELFEYDERGNLIREVNPLGHVTIHRYDEYKNRVFTQGPDWDTEIHYLYDFSNRLIQEEHKGLDGTSRSIHHKYNYLGQEVSRIDSSGNETQFVYDDLGNQTEVICPPVPSLGGELVRPKETKTYDILGNVTSVIDSEGRVTRTVYNIYGKPTHIVYPDGSEEKMTYTLDGKLKKAVGKSGLSTQFSYDFLGRMVEKITSDPSGKVLAVESWNYNALHLLSHKDPEGRITTYTYDYAGRQSVIRVGEQETRFEYDAMGRCNKTIAGGIRVTKSTFDDLNRLVATTVEDINGRVLRLSEISYDVRGNQVSNIDHMQDGPQITKSVYDDQNRPIKIIDPVGNTIVTEYNDCYLNDFGQKVLGMTITDPMGRQTLTIKDALGRDQKILKKDPFGVMLAQTEFVYNLSGDLISSKQTVFVAGRPDRIITNSFSYDKMHRLKEMIQAKGSSDERHTYTSYNEIGEKTKVTKPDGTTLHYEYDLQGRLAHFFSTDFEYSYTYNQNNELLLVLDHKNNTETVRTYDQNGLLVFEKLGNHQEMAFAYDALQRPIKITYPDGSGSEYSYDAASLTAIHRLSSLGERTYSHTYSARDLAGNILESGPVSYSYDGLSRLTSITSPCWSEKKITYDSASNLISFTTEDFLSTLTRCFSYDSLNQLAEESGGFHHTYTHDSLLNRTTYDNTPILYNDLNQPLSETYTLNGCLAGKGDHIYTYDSLDRLIRVQTGSSTITYTYDSFNRLLTRSSTTSNDDEHFLYIGQNEVGRVVNQEIRELRLLGEGRGAEIGAAVYIEINQDSYIPIHDHSGNVTVLLDLSLEPRATYRYSAFGQCAITSCLSPWRYASKRQDPETHLIYFGRRFYNTTSGRWLTPDPLGYEAGSNLYAYVNNSPASYVDPYGLEVETGSRLLANCNLGQYFPVHLYNNSYYNFSTFNA